METWSQPQVQLFSPRAWVQAHPSAELLLFYLYPLQTKKKPPYNSFGVFWKQKGWERSLESVQVSRSGLHFSWYWNRGEGEKGKLQNYNWGKTKASLTLSLLFHWWSLSESCVRTDFYFLTLRMTEFPRQIPGFSPADVATSSLPLQASLLTDSIIR